MQQPTIAAWFRAACVLCLFLSAMGCLPAGAQAPAPGKPPVAEKPVGPAWNTLSPTQQQALKPLETSWNGLSVGQKRKWIEVSKNFNSLSPTDQSKLHSHMAGWVALSPQQRAQARLNYAQANQLSSDEKKAKWEAYQALSPEEKQRLAAKAAPKPGVAAAIKPVPKAKLANVQTRAGAVVTTKQAVQPIAHHPHSTTTMPHPMDAAPPSAQQVPVVAPAQP